LRPTTKIVKMIPTGRSRRNPKPSALLLNNPEAALPSQQQAIVTFRAAEAARRAAETELTLEIEVTNATTPTSSRDRSPNIIGWSPEVITPPAAFRGSKISKRPYVSDEEEESSDEESNDEREDARTNPKPKGNARIF
jgi:hypothetical protein